MTLQEILGLRYDVEGNKKRLQKALSKTKWLERFADNPEDITLEVLESLYRKVITKYPAKIGYIKSAGNGSMLCMIKNYETHKWIETIYFISFWECMAKVILVQYGYCILGIKFKDKDKDILGINFKDKGRRAEWRAE